MRIRSVLHVALPALLAAPLLLVAGASMASAVNRDDGDQPGRGLPIGETLLIYGGIPAALFALIAVLVYAPSLTRSPRYRPGLTWFAAPVWINGPDASDTAIPETAIPDTAMPDTAMPDTVAGGGASARW